MVVIIKASGERRHFLISKKRIILKMKSVQKEELAVMFIESWLLYLFESWMLCLLEQLYKSALTLNFHQIALLMACK